MKSRPLTSKLNFYSTPMKLLNSELSHYSEIPKLRLSSDNEKASHNVFNEFKHKETFTTSVTNFKFVKKPKRIAKEKLKIVYDKEKYIKKSIKGKLMNLVNKHTIVNVEEISPYLLTSNTTSNIIDNSKKFRPLDDRIKLNIITKRNPSLLEDSTFQFSTRLADHLITADELVYKNFNREEIQVMRSDPIFFGLNRTMFASVDFFRPKTLKEVLDKEEKGSIDPVKDLEKSIRNTLNILKEKIYNYDYFRKLKVDKNKPVGKNNKEFGFRTVKFNYQKNDKIDMS